MRLASEQDQDEDVDIKAIGEIEWSEAPPLSREQRLWLDVLCSAVREAFSYDERRRNYAREWLLGPGRGDFSAAWVCSAVGLVSFSRLQAWVRTVPDEVGRKRAKLLFKARP